MQSAFSGAYRRFRVSRLILGLLMALPLTAAAIEVDRAELEKGGTKKIVFINYEGPYATIDSSEDILGIGLALGRAIKAGATRAGEESRYYAVHSATKGSGSGQFDADIIGLGVDAGVDHIKNLRLILRGFLQGAYDYAPADAALLAEFATVYNAVYRGDWTYFSDHYRQPVLASLDKDKAGLSVRFDEWPGRAQIVIPLSEKAAPGSLSAVDTTSLTEKKVVEQLRKTEDRGVEPRKDMVDLKEREAAQARQTATLEREAIVDEEKKLAEEKAALQAEKDRIAAEEKKAAESKKAAAAGTTGGAAGTATTGDAKTDGATGTDATGKAAADEKNAAPAKTAAAAAEEKKAEEKLAADKKAVAEKETAIAAQEKTIEKKKTEAAKKEEFAAKKDAEASADRNEIAKDQQQVIKKEQADAAAKLVTGELALRMAAANEPYARFVLIDTTTGTELKASPLDTVHARSTAELDGKIYAVAGKEGGNGAIRLVIVDKTTLEMKKQGDIDLQAQSPVWVKGKDLYALIRADGGPRLARFDTELALKAKSTEPVHPFAVPTFASGLVLIQASDGSVMMLKEADLSK